MKYRETMRATQAPDVYDGPNCDQHRPQWVGSAEGDMDGDGEIGRTIKFDARTFPPGTKVTIEEPECPDCGCIPHKMKGNRWRCECDFDWKEWAADQFS